MVIGWLVCRNEGGLFARDSSTISMAVWSFEPSTYGKSSFPMQQWMALTATIASLFWGPPIVTRLIQSKVVALNPGGLLEVSLIAAGERFNFAKCGREREARQIVWLPTI